VLYFSSAGGVLEAPGRCTFVRMAISLPNVGKKGRNPASCRNGRLYGLGVSAKQIEHGTISVEHNTISFLPRPDGHTPGRCTLCTYSRAFDTCSRALRHNEAPAANRRRAVRDF